jgi:hypothetical protein
MLIWPLARHLLIRRALERLLHHLALRLRLHKLQRRLLRAVFWRELVSGTPDSGFTPRIVALALEIIDLRFQGCDFGVPRIGPAGDDQKRKRAEN